MNEEEEKVPAAGDLNPDALEASLGDDFVEIDEDAVVVPNYGDDEDDIDVAFSQDDPRDWY